MAHIKVNLCDVEPEDGAGEPGGLANKADIMWILAASRYMDDDAILEWVWHALRRSMQKPADIVGLDVEHAEGPERWVCILCRYDIPEWKNVARIARDLMDVRGQYEPGFGVRVDEDLYTGDDPER